MKEEHECSLELGGTERPHNPSLGGGASFLLTPRPDNPSLHRISKIICSFPFSWSYFQSLMDGRAPYRVSSCGKILPFSAVLDFKLLLMFSNAKQIYC